MERQIKGSKKLKVMAETWQQETRQKHCFRTGLAVQRQLQTLLLTE